MKQLFVFQDKCLGCRSCVIACAVEHSKHKSLFLAIQERPRPVPRIEVEQTRKGLGSKIFPAQCRHCEEPYCIDACIAGAISKDSQTGLVTSDEDKCVGCWMCVMVCPFGVIRPGKEQRIAIRCDLCQDKDIPACVEACPTGALFFGEAQEFKKKLIELQQTNKTKPKIN